ncbi:MAG: hypothetical protein ACOCRO_04575 [Halanaerobiales bacterium]
MQLNTEFIKKLIDLDDPLPLIWEFLRENIWYSKNNLEDYYWQGEMETNEFEKALDQIYGTIYSKYLPYMCFNKKFNISFEEINTLIIMDGLSIREAGLLIPLLKKQGYNVEESFNFSAIPSDTLFFRDKIDYTSLKKNYNSIDIKDSDPNLTGEEELIWCRFPDAFHENIQSGKTKLSSIEKAFEKTKEIIFKILKQLNGPFIITSDHGYTRTEAGCTFNNSTNIQRELRNKFGSNRFIKMDNVNLDRLVKENVCIDYNGYYLARARNTWSVSGKYSVFSHGGVSLLECITPHIKVTRGGSNNG